MYSSTTRDRPGQRMNLKADLLHRELLRTLTFFTLEPPDAAFVRKSKEFPWKMFRAISDLLLTGRGQIRHPDPGSLVPAPHSFFALTFPARLIMLISSTMANIIQFVAIECCCTATEPACGGHA